MERQSGEVPLPRFGHTCSQVSNSFIVLFGGATGEGGRYTINNDTYVLDLKNNTWRKLVLAIDAQTSSPSPRAAHCSCCVDAMQMVVYGGATGGGALSSDDLYLLDVRSIEKDGKFSWMTIPVQGATPGKRYGHSMVYSRPLLILFGGNNGQTALGDVWTLDVEKSPFIWNQVRVIDPTKVPLARVYHSAALCTEGPAAGMTVIFGGRTGDNKSLNDTWGLRQHRDGRWDWVEAPARRGSPPESRYQHCCVFHGKKLLVAGGRGNEASKRLPMSVYDTEACEWKDFSGFVERFRHSVWVTGSSILMSYGGFSHVAPSSPTGELESIRLDDLFSNRPNSTHQESPQTTTVPQSSIPTMTLAQLAAPVSRVTSPPVTSVGIAHQVYVSLDKDPTVRRVGIETLGEESRKVGPVNPFGGVVSAEPQSRRALDIARKVIDNLLQPTSWRAPIPESKFFMSVSDLNQLCLAVLEVVKNQPMLLELRAPIKIFGDIHGQFPDLMRLFAQYGSPSDVDGDLDAVDYLFLGDFVDRGSFSLETVCLLFALKCKFPNQIHLVRGNHEDATINGLYGFKDECRRRIREDPDSPLSVYNLINALFEYLPCGAVIDGKVLCIHGGIGGSIESLCDIANLPRPLKVSQTPTSQLEQRVTDLLWSDPTDSDVQGGVLSNETRDPDGTGRIVKYGPDRVEKFLNRNSPLQLIVRAHECVMDGFERFAGGKLITVFSATDYCGHHKNAGALLFIKRDLTVVPKLIFPVDRSSGTWDNGSIRARPPTPPRGVSDYLFHQPKESSMLSFAHQQLRRFAD
jgi:protein phosphatase